MPRPAGGPSCTKGAEFGTLLAARHLQSMGLMPSPDDLVKIEKAPGAHTIAIGGGDLPQVKVGPYANPALAEKDAESFRALLAALLASRHE